MMGLKEKPASGNRAHRAACIEIIHALQLRRKPGCKDTNETFRGF